MRKGSVSALLVFKLSVLFVSLLTILVQGLFSLEGVSFKVQNLKTKKYKDTILYQESEYLKTLNKKDQTSPLFPQRRK